MLAHDVNRLRNIMCEIFTIINGMTAEYLGKLVTLKDIPLESRSVIPLFRPKVRTVLYGQRRFRYEGAKLWNMVLPHYFKSCWPLKDFKQFISTNLGQKSIGVSLYSWP